MMKTRMIVMCLLLSLHFAGIKAQVTFQMIATRSDSVPYLKRAGIALSEIIGLNLGV